MAAGSLQRRAIAVATLITVGLVVVHLQYHRHAGPLWRDEVNSVNLANFESYGEVLANIHLDSFPVAWGVLLHSWVVAGLGESDVELRRLGLLIGLLTVALLWWCGRRVGVGPPLVTLVLFGMSPSVIVYGDEIRGYGLGALTIAWCFAAIWGFAERPAWRSFVVAQIATIVAAQTSFANCLLIATIVAAALAVCLRRRDWSTLVAIMLLSLVSAALLFAVNGSTLAYMASTAGNQRGQWTLFWRLQVFANALGAGVTRLSLQWGLAAIAAGIAVGLARSNRAHVEPALFIAVVVPLSIVVFFLALEPAHIPTQYWHYLSLMVVMALSLDVGLKLLAQHWAHGESVRIAAVLAGALVALPGVYSTVALRMTDLDLAATAIEERSRPGDLAVVFPWQFGITFQRYYRGPAPWITIPDFDEHKFHRHRIVDEKIAIGEAAVTPELARVEATLRAGNTVWIVGTPVAPPGGQAPARVPEERRTLADPFVENWELQLGALLQNHAVNGVKLELPEVGQVNAWETSPLWRVDGWR